MGTGEENRVADPAEYGAAAYGGLHEPARGAGTNPTATELRPYRRSDAGFHYPWVEDFLMWLEDKGAHREYHAWLEHTRPLPERSTLVADEYLWSPGIAPPSRALTVQERTASRRFEVADAPRYTISTNLSSTTDLVDDPLSQSERAT